MSDELDPAAALEELERTIALANRKRPEMQFTGACYNCEKSVDKGFSVVLSAVRITSALSALSSSARWHDAGSGKRAKDRSA